MKSIEDLIKIRDEAAKSLSLRDQKNGFRIVVGMATCGITAGARTVLNSLVEEVGKRQLNNVTITQVGCIGECALEPIVEVYDNKGIRTTYCKVNPLDTVRIIEEHIIQGLVVEDLLIVKYKKVGNVYD